MKTGLGLAALASAAQGWALRKTTRAERLLLLLAGLLMVFPGLLEALVEAIIGRDIDYTATFGMLIGAAVLIKQWMLPAPPRRKATRRAIGRTRPMMTCAARFRSPRWRLAAVRVCRRRRRAEHEHRHRHRRHRRRLLSARRRHGERAVEIRARRAGDGARDRRLGRQSAAHPYRPERGRAGDGRCRARCATRARTSSRARRSPCAR